VSALPDLSTTDLTGRKEEILEKNRPVYDEFRRAIDDL